MTLLFSLAGLLVLVFIMLPLLATLVGAGLDGHRGRAAPGRRAALAGCHVLCGVRRHVARLRVRAAVGLPAGPPRLPRQEPCGGRHRPAHHRPPHGRRHRSAHGVRAERRRGKLVRVVLDLLHRERGRDRAGDALRERPVVHRRSSGGHRGRRPSSGGRGPHPGRVALAGGVGR